MRRQKASLRHMAPAAARAFVIVMLAAAACLVPGETSRAVAAPSTLPAGAAVTATASGTAPGSTSGTKLDAATREALALEDSIERAQEDAIALEQRIGAANSSILQQESVLDGAQENLAQAESRFQSRVVQIYKSGVGSPFLVLFSARSLSQLWTSLSLLAKVIDQDTVAYRDAQLASREAEYQASVLDDEKAQLVQLRALRSTRLAELNVALARQRRVVATLSEQSKQIVAKRQAAAKLTRAQWRASSIPLGTKIPFAEAVVEPYRDRTYLVAAYQPRRYRTTGERFTAVTSWYGDAFNGRPSASGQIYNMDDLTCASRTLPFGTRIALTRGNKRVVVVVNDRGPYVAGRNLDLSYAAARALDFWGVATMEAEFVEVVPRAASR